MKIFTSEQIHQIDQYTIEQEPVSSLDLMERASCAFVQWFVGKFPLLDEFIVFVGPGNNGGDGLAIARMLFDGGYNGKVYVVSQSLSSDAESNLRRLNEYGKNTIMKLTETSDINISGKNTIVIDALFGSGLSRPLGGFFAELVHWINRSGLKVVSIDIPSGLFCEDNTNNVPDNIILANYTISFEFPKLAFFFPSNYRFIGEWQVVPIGLHQGFIRNLPSAYYYFSLKDAAFQLRPRLKSAHKGNFGHALLLAGCHGMMGAAVLSAKACMRSGVGLLTVHVPSCGYDIMQVSVPEAMCNTDLNSEFISLVPELSSYTAIGIGPGIGQQTVTAKALEVLLANASCPLVIDADALNLISQHRNLISLLPENTIITPHPKEFDRLAGVSASSWERHIKQRQFASENKTIVVLKGSNTIVSMPDGSSYININGNPGMATAGSGDVLTGMILSLLAQGYDPRTSAVLGVFLHGKSGDLAASDMGVESLLASDIIAYIGKTFRLLNEVRIDSAEFNNSIESK
jgi:ADP-dependent NAD(P)H-hydrate dehydratase / NAD(P)H-hydrate epimerase